MKTQVHYLFSKNNKIGSKLIRWGTAFLQPEIKNTPSHVAVLVNNKWVIESTLEHGFRVLGYSAWKTVNEETHKIESNRLWNFQDLKNLYKPLRDKKYDFPGVLYFSWRIFLMKFFNISKPEKNKFNYKDKYFCSEVVGKMNNVNYEMTSPVELLAKTKKKLI